MINFKQFISQWMIPPGIRALLSGALIRLRGRQHLSPEAIQLLEQNKQIFDRHKGERCFILGAGSSIAKQDLKKLAGEYIISVSNTYVHPDYPIIKPQYHVLPHILVGHSTIHSQEKFVEWLREMEPKTLNAEMFFHIGDKVMIDSNGLFTNRIIHWNEYCHWDETCNFSLDLAKVPAIGSVSEFAITVALYLGFDKIYLLGFDHDWFNGPQVYFYDAMSHALKTTRQDLAFADAEFQMRRHANIFKKYKCLYRMKENIYNANANPNHYLDVFPKVDYDTLFIDVPKSG